MRWWDRWKVWRRYRDHMDRGHAVLIDYCFTCDQDLTANGDTGSAA